MIVYVHVYSALMLWFMISEHWLSNHCPRLVTVFVIHGPRVVLIRVRAFNRAGIEINTARVLSQSTSIWRTVRCQALYACYALASPLPMENGNALLRCYAA